MAYKFTGTIKTGSSSVSIPVLLRSTADNTAVTGTAYGSVTAYYWRQGGSATQITTSALGSITADHSAGGWYQVDATNMPGLYRLDLPDAMFAAPSGDTDGDWVCLVVKVANTYGHYDRWTLETAGFKDLNDELTHADYGLDQLVRSTTPANTLTVDASGDAYADVRLWLASAPAALTSTLVQAQANQLGTQAKTDVASEVSDELDTAISELSVGGPTATPTVRTALAMMYMAMRNKLVNDGSYVHIYNSSGTEVFKFQISEASGTFTRNAVSSP